MKIILQPVSHPAIGEITIADTLFAIGRREEPFASLDGNVVGRLSRRHARIFQEDGKAYIVDLGSSHGTELNAQRLQSDAAMLHDSDVLTLAGKLSFRVGIERDGPRAVPPPPGLRVTLTPVDTADELEPFTIEEFPFVISRNDPIFDRFLARFPEEMRRVSRRHAILTLRGEQLWVEDLASVNGTFLDGKRLDERAQRISAGETIAFGGDRFAFRVDLEMPAALALPEGREPSPVADAATPSVAPSASQAALLPQPAAALPAAASSASQVAVLPTGVSSSSRIAALPAAASSASQVAAPPIGASSSSRIAALPAAASSASQVAVPPTGASSASQVAALPAAASSASQVAVPPTGASSSSRIAVLPTGASSSSRIAVLPTSASSAAAAPVTASPATKRAATSPGAASPEPASAPRLTSPPQPTNINRTRFVSTATSFLDVFCPENEPDDAVDAAVPTLSTRTLPVQQGLLQRGLVRARDIWHGVRGRQEIDRRLLWSAGAVLATLLVAVGLVYLLGSGRREIKSRLDDKAYRESAAAANRYLERHTDDYEASEWADEALIRAVVPQWTALIEQRRFDDAERQLLGAKTTYRFIRRGQEMIDLLGWAGRVEAHLARRGGTEAAIVMFRDEEPIRSLVEEWDKDALRHQQLMDQIVAYDPSFERMQNRLFSDMRTLRNDDLLYVKAISELKSGIRKSLPASDTDGINALLSDFASSYSRVAGVGALRADLKDYDTLARHVQQRELDDVIQLRHSLKFRTPIFADYVGKWLDQVLPPAGVLSQYDAAAVSWRAGEQERAITILEQLTDGPWGEVAKARIARYRSIGADFVALRAERGTSGYGDHLLEFMSSLQMPADEFFIKAVQPDFLAEKDRVLQRLAQSLPRVKAQWQAYRGDGGISGTVRVEASVSEHYSKQARRLSAAYADVVAGSRLYKLIETTPPADWESLHTDVVSEATRQRRWLQDLSLVLAPTLLRAKLNLLPDIKEQTR